MNKNWKKLTKSVVGVAAVLVGAITAQAAVITLQPSTATPTAGSNFSIDVLVTGVFDPPHAADLLTSFGFNVAAPAGVSYLGFTPGPLFDPLLLPGVDVGGITQDPFLVPPVVEPLLLATLNFLAVSPGTALVSISGNPTGDPNLGLHFIDPADIEAQTTINVGAASGVPEPSSMLLAGVGLVLAAARFYKR